MSNRHQNPWLLIESFQKSRFWILGAARYGLYGTLAQVVFPTRLSLYLSLQALGEKDTKNKKQSSWLSPTFYGLALPG